MIVWHSGAAVLEHRPSLAPLREVKIPALRSFTTRYQQVGSRYANFSAGEFAPNPTTYAPPVQVHLLHENFKEFFFGMKEVDPPEGNLSLFESQDDFSDVAIASHPNFLEEIPALKGPSLLYRLLLMKKEAFLKEKVTYLCYCRDKRGVLRSITFEEESGKLGWNIRAYPFPRRIKWAKGTVVVVELPRR